MTGLGPSTAVRCGRAGSSRARRGEANFGCRGADRGGGCPERSGVSTFGCKWPIVVGNGHSDCWRKGGIRWTRCHSENALSGARWLPASRNHHCRETKGDISGASRATTWDFFCAVVAGASQPPLLASETRSAGGGTGAGRSGLPKRVGVAEFCPERRCRFVVQQDVGEPPDEAPRWREATTARELRLEALRSACERKTRSGGSHTPHLRFDPADGVR